MNAHYQGASEPAGSSVDQSIARAEVAVREIRLSMQRVSAQLNPEGFDDDAVIEACNAYLAQLPSAERDRLLNDFALTGGPAADQESPLRNAAESGIGRIVPPSRWI